MGLHDLRVRLFEYVRSQPASHFYLGVGVCFIFLMMGYGLDGQMVHAAVYGVLAAASLAIMVAKMVDGF